MAGKASSPVAPRPVKEEPAESPALVAEDPQVALKEPGVAPRPSKMPEHKSFELEDLPDDNPINCHPRAFATRVECHEAPPLSPQPTKPSSKYDYPIVRHHPLFAKNQRCRSGTISSLLVGENIEFFRKPGAARTGVQSTRKSVPKLLTFEIYNPETDDLDSDSSQSSSPDSGESVISVISDRRSFDEQSKKEPATCPGLEIHSPEEEIIFKFDFAEKTPEVISPPTPTPTPDIAELTPADMEKANELMNIEEIERKSEARKQTLMSLLDENKAVLEDITRTKTVVEVSWKTAGQLQSMEELRLPSLDRSRSSSSSPERRDWHSEGDTGTRRGREEEEEERRGSLDDLPSLSEQGKKTEKTSRKLEETSQKAAEAEQKTKETGHNLEETGSKTTEMDKKKEETGQEQEERGQKTKETFQKAADTTQNAVETCATTEKTDDRTDETDPKTEETAPKMEGTSGKTEEASRKTEEQGRRRRVSSGQKKVLQHSQRVEEEVVSEEVVLVAPIAICVTEVEAADVEEKEEIAAKEEELPALSPDPWKLKECAGKSLIRSESKEEEKVPLPSRRLDKRRRDDSLESNPASIKSSVQLSDTSSMISHRFSTISISSNVSSDVSLGNTSVVSGSSCYLASMSSADFDDRPPLASSFSLSEAEEEREKEGEPTAEGSKSPPKKDQLSPPRATSKAALLAGRGERPKLKSLFKRTSDGRSKSHSSSEGRSREGEGECLAVKGARSRISTLSSTTPGTSLEQSTCVERCSSSFEEEMLRSKGHEEEVGDDNAFSASDSDDSAEAGGNLTHHRCLQTCHLSS